MVIHDLATNKIAYLANNLSKRKPGDDAGLEDFELDGGAGVTGPYEKLNWDGKKMRSVSIAARDEQGKPSYLLCINLSTAMFEDARNALDMFYRSRDCSRSRNSCSKTTGRRRSTPSCMTGCGARTLRSAR